MKALSLLERKQFLLQEIRILREIAKGASLRRQASQIRNARMLRTARVNCQTVGEQGIPGLLAAE